MESRYRGGLHWACDPYGYRDQSVLAERPRSRDAIYCVLIHCFLIHYVLIRRFLIYIVLENSKQARDMTSLACFVIIVISDLVFS